MRKREVDPLDVIPTSKAVERWLTAAEERVRRLKVLLTTAVQIEGRTDNEKSDTDISCFSERQEVSNV